MLNTSPGDRSPSDARTISLVGLVHGTSHFFHMLLPPLFMVFASQFEVSFAALGALVTVFFAVSGIGQALSGFGVDRLGARPVLVAGLMCFCAAALVASQAQGLSGLMVAAALAGLGNAPFHPVDFTILNHRVQARRLGHAFAVHGISGNLGWALAPVFLLGLTELLGSWRWAMGAAAMLAALVLLVVLLNWSTLDDQRAAPMTRGAPTVPTSLSFLRLPSVWLCFAFFVATTIALTAVQSFATPALSRMHGVDAGVLAYLVTSYMLAGAVGMVIGGFVVGHAKEQAKLEPTIALSLLSSAALLALAAWPGLPLGLAWVCLIGAGFGSGLAGPSRDLLIKQAAPAGATGRVYGTVYSGLDIGYALSAPVFGALLDRGQPAAVFLGAAAGLVLAVSCTGVLRWRSRAAAAVPALKT